MLHFVQHDKLVDASFVQHDKTEDVIPNTLFCHSEHSFLSFRALFFVII